MLFYISKVLFVYQQVIIVQKYASNLNREFSIFQKTVLSHLNWMQVLAAWIRGSSGKQALGNNPLYTIHIV